MSYSKTSLTFLITLLSSGVFAKSDLDEIVVVSSRIDQPLEQVGVAVTVVDQQEIALRGGQSLTALMRTLPGISGSNSGGAGKDSSIRIRGEEGFRTLLLIDGVEVSDVSAPQVASAFQYVDTTADVARIEILRGPQGFIYGADAGGVVHITTQQGSDFHGGLSLENGEYQSQRQQAFLSLGKDALSAFISAAESETEGFNARTGDITGEKDGYKNKTLHGKFGLQLDDQWSSQLVLRDVHGKAEYDGCYGSNGPSQDCLADYDQQIGKLSFNYDGERISQHFAAANTQVDRQYLAEGDLSYAAQGDLQKFEYWGALNLNELLNFTFGADYKVEKILSSVDHWDARHQTGLFSEVLWSLSERTHVSFGIRNDDHEVFGGHLSKRITAVHTQPVGDGGLLKYRAAWGTGFRAPSLSEVSYNASLGLADVPLKEEVSQGGELGVEYYAASGATFQTTVFDQSVEDQIEYGEIPGKGYGYTQALGISHSQGIELAGKIPLSSQLAIHWNYTYNDTLAVDDGPRSRRPKHVANVLFMGSWFNNQLQAALSLRAARDAVNRLYDGTEEIMDDYVLSDLNMAYQADKDVVIKLALNNVFGKEYQDVNGYNVDEGSYTLGIQWSF